MALSYLLGNFTLHTLIHTFALGAKLQYFGLNEENAEFLAPLFISQHLVPDPISAKCELRDVIHTFALIGVSFFIIPVSQY